jgi:hypothetical protein
MADSHFGPIMPYGVAIREAAASGDKAKLQQAITHARGWLEKNPGHEKQGEVHEALREVEGNS